MILLVGASATVPGVLHFLLKSPGFDATDLFLVRLPSELNYQGSFRGLTVVERPESVSRSARLPAGS
jgi:hypothetical protein